MRVTGFRNCVRMSTGFWMRRSPTGVPVEVIPQGQGLENRADKPVSKLDRLKEEEGTRRRSGRHRQHGLVQRVD